jgi:hypothetical protein
VGRVVLGRLPRLLLVAEHERAERHRRHHVVERAQAVVVPPVELARVGLVVALAVDGLARRLEPVARVGGEGQVEAHAPLEQGGEVDGADGGGVGAIGRHVERAAGAGLGDGDVESGGAVASGGVGVETIGDDGREVPLEPTTLVDDHGERPLRGGVKVALGVEHVADGRQRLWLGQLARVELALVATVVAALVDMAVEFGVDGLDVVAVCAQRFVGSAEIGDVRILRFYFHKSRPIGLFG